jgi:death on curing protein
VTDYLDTEDVLRIHHAVHGCNQLACVRDLGMIEAAAARPRASAFGRDGYPDLWHKGAALLHSIAAGQVFTDGNKRTAWRCAWVFLGLNGTELDPDFDVDAAEALMLGIDNRSEVPEIAEALKGFAPT